MKVPVGAKVRYIQRPKPQPTTWSCDKCSTTITLYVDPTVVEHRCLKTRKWSKLVVSR